MLSEHIRCILGSVNLPPVLPTLFDDIQMRMDRCGKQGVIDPFKDVYNVYHVFSGRCSNLTFYYLIARLPNDRPHGLLPRTCLGPPRTH